MTELYYFNVNDKSVNRSCLSENVFVEDGNPLLKTDSILKTDFVVSEN